MKRDIKLTVLFKRSSLIDSSAKGFLTATGIPNDSTVYFTGTQYERTGKQLWTSVNDLVKDIKSAQLWDSFHAIYPFIGNSASTCMWNLKDPRDLDTSFRIAFTGGWSYSGAGAKANGTNSQANTFLTPSTTLAASNKHISVYTQEALANNGIGASATTADQILHAFGQLFSNLSVNGVGVSYTSLRGYYIGSRITSTASQTYVNGVLANTDARNSAQQPNIPLMIGARNNSVVDFYSSNTFSFATVGLGLSADKAATLNTIVASFQDKLGRKTI